MKSFKYFIVCFMTIMAVVLSKAVFAAELGQRYSDIEANAWYTEAVEYCVENNLMDGTSNTTFSPNAMANRSTLVTALYHQAGNPVVERTNVFTDVTSQDVNSQAIAWSQANGIVTGYDDGRFGVEDPVTREQLVTILWRLNNRPAADNRLSSFADASSISDYAIDAVSWAKEQAIISGKGNNLFDPTGYVTRAELAMLLFRLDNKQEATAQVISPTGNQKTLVVYYSATGNTEAVARSIAKATVGTLFELQPVEPYSNEDLNWTNNNSRVVREHDNPNERNVPLQNTEVPDWETYDTVFIGYPIWWGIAAWPVDGFVKANDFTGKTVIPFCTSSSSGLGESGTLLKDAAGTGNWEEGMRFRSGTSDEEIQSWITDLGLNT